VPLYKQLYYKLKQKMIDGEKKPGDIFYSENELIERYDVSSITVRSTLQMLEDEGFLKKSQGSASIVVDQEKYTWNLYDLTDDLRRFEGDLQTKIISMSIEVPSKEVLENLDLDETTEEVYRIERVRSVGDKKMARSISYLIPSLSLDINNIQFNENYSITELLRQEGEAPFYAEETLEAVNADEKTSRLLDLQTDAAVFLRKRVTYDENDKPLEYVISYYNSQNTRYYIKNKLL